MMKQFIVSVALEKETNRQRNKEDKSVEKHELERLIATNFLGWKGTKWQNQFIDDRGNMVDVRNTFTEKIEYTWKIAEKLKKDWTDFSISNDEEKWNVSWGFDGYGWRDVSADSVEMALCIACLQSKNIKINVEDIEE